jgi:hypothetical protein
MACTPQVLIADPPAGSCIPQEYVDFLRTSISILNPCSPSGQVGIVVSNVPPGVDDTNLIWLKTNALGAPLYFLAYYGGTWRKICGVPVGAKVWYSGPLASIFDLTTGKGLQGGEWDGWIIRHSDDNKFMVVAESYNGTNWVSNVTGSILATGGVATNTLLQTDVPITPAAAVSVGHANATGQTNVGTWAGVILGVPGGGNMGDTVLLPANPGNTSPTAFSNVPPFAAAALVEYLGIT